MKTKKLLMLLAITFSVLVLAVLFIPACAKPAEGPGTPEAPSPAPAEVFHWRYASWATPAVMFGYKWHPDLCKRIEEMSGGRITVEFVTGAMTGGTSIFDAIRAGIVDMGTAAGGAIYSVMPEAKCLYIPFAFRKVEEPLTMFYARGYEDLLRESFMELDPPVHLLAPEIYPTSLTMVNTPVTSLADLGKLKIRAMGTIAEWMERIGLNTVTVAEEEVYMALATGTIDGAEGFTADENYDMKVYEYAKYIVEPPFMPCRDGGDYVVNIDSWNSLPEDLQAIVTAAARESSLLSAVGGQTIDSEYRQKLLDQGCSVCVLEGAEDNALMAEKAREIWDEVAALSPRNAVMMDMFEDYMRELGYID